MKVRLWLVVGVLCVGWSTSIMATSIAPEPLQRDAIEEHLADLKRELDAVSAEVSEGLSLFNREVLGAMADRVQRGRAVEDMPEFPQALSDLQQRKANLERVIRVQEELLASVRAGLASARVSPSSAERPNLAPEETAPTELRVQSERLTAARKKLTLYKNLLRRARAAGNQKETARLQSLVAQQQHLISGKTGHQTKIQAKAHQGRRMADRGLEHVYGSIMDAQRVYFATTSEELPADYDVHLIPAGDSPEALRLQALAEDQTNLREMRGAARMMTILAGDVETVADQAGRLQQWSRAFPKGDQSKWALDIASLRNRASELEHFNLIETLAVNEDGSRRRSGDMPELFEGKSKEEIGAYVDAMAKQAGWDQDLKWETEDRDKWVARAAAGSRTTHRKLRNAADIAMKDEPFLDGYATAEATWDEGVAAVRDRANDVLEAGAARAVARTGGEVLPEDAAHLQLASQIGQELPDVTGADAHCLGPNASKEVCSGLKKSNVIAQKGALFALNAAKQGRSSNVLEASDAYMGELLAEQRRAEQPWYCAGWAQTTGQIVGGGAHYGGMGLKFVGWDVPKFVIWDAPKYGLGKLSQGVSAVTPFFEKHGTQVQQGLFAVFSALAQHQYMKKGSRSSNTSMYRALSIIFGANLQAGGNLPASMIKNIDPLEPFKQAPMSSQQIVENVRNIVSDAMTIGGDAASGSGYPYGTREHMEALLSGRAVAGADVKKWYQNRRGRTMYEPDYRRFAGRAYGGYVPSPNLSTDGVQLDPNFAADNPRATGSGLADLNFTAATPQEGIQAFENLSQQTEVVKDGVALFAQAMETQVNPPTNSTAALVNAVGGASASQSTLNGVKNDLARLLSQGTRGPNALRNLQAQKEAEIGRIMREIIGIDNQAVALEAQIFTSYPDLVRDSDGLRPSSRSEWSAAFEQFSATQKQIRYNAIRRADLWSALEELDRYPVMYWQRQAEQPKGSFPAPQAWMQKLRTIFIKPLFAKEQQQSPVPDNWKEILQGYMKDVSIRLEEKSRIIAEKSPELRKLVSLDPKGIHEVNMGAIDDEAQNMRLLALQSGQNLDKLQRAEKAVTKNRDIVPEEKAAILKNILQYRAVVSKLREEAEGAAKELARVERLQFEKVQVYDQFQVEKELGESLLKRLRVK